MAELKTQLNNRDPKDFLNALSDEKRKADAFAIMELMQEVTGEEPKMWGSSIIGFGHYHYKYESGREGDWFLTGFSPRKQNLALYLMGGATRHQSLLEKMGKYKTGKSCLYITKLEDIDRNVLKEIVRQSIQPPYPPDFC